MGFVTVALGFGHVLQAPASAFAQTERTLPSQFHYILRARLVHPS
jgi:hypothetical protein